MTYLFDIMTTRTRGAHRASFAVRVGRKRNFASRKAVKAAGHDYTIGAGCTEEPEAFKEGFPLLPVTPSTTPAMQRKTSEAVESNSLSMDMLKQFEEVKKQINSRCDSITVKLFTWRKSWSTPPLS